MNDNPSDPWQAADLRRRAEAQAHAAAHPDTLTAEQLRQLAHELQVHQIELELQNEELRRTQTALEVSRARYFDLFDLAPVGYLTLSAAGLIQEANLTAATLLGVTRTQLINWPFTRFILPEDQDTYYQRHRQLCAAPAGAAIL